MRSFKKSVQYAFRGLKYVIKNERNFKIELFFAVAILFFCAFLGVERWELVVIIFLTTLVLVTELINTVVERVVDILEPRMHPFAKLIKDITAAIVLISAIMSVIIGLIIFLPYILR
ncbi:MAG: diacylglycerol kinase family protein [Candidatus Moranbacteria bacterium]|nr:diacylglycerol kinase family protein [Candidatus Moranbacteria bacterium]